MATRGNILNRLRSARKENPQKRLVKPDWETPIYHPAPQDLTAWFKENLELIGGQVLCVDNLEGAASKISSIKAEKGWDKIYCLNSKLNSAFSPQLDILDKADFLDAKVGITTCEYLVAHLGSVLVSSKGESGRRLYVYPESHIVIAHTGQIQTYLDDALAAIEKKYQAIPSQISNITGPSRTADIEKTLVMGMHGPKELTVIICQEPF